VVGVALIGAMPRGQPLAQVKLAGIGLIITGVALLKRAA
jgi:multidrug transporter EmrE-like cation transporter